MPESFSQILFSKPLQESPEVRQCRAHQTFTYEEVEAAKQVAFSHGVEEGERIKDESIAKMTLAALQRIDEGITALINDADKDTDLFCDLLTMAIKKISPALENHLGLANICIMLQEHISALSRSGYVKVMVHQSIVSSLTTCLTEKGLLTKQMIIEPDQLSGQWDCRVIWECGEIRKSFEETLQRILSLIEQHMETNKRTEE